MIDFICGNAKHIPLPSESVQCVITSPPYWALRDYGIAGQIGQEASPEDYVKNLVIVFREVYRILKPDGTVWLNLGDTYAGSGGSGGDYNKGGLREDQPRYVGSAALVRSKRIKRGNGSGRWGGGDRKVMSLPRKNLIGIPWRVAFALQADGWILRQDIIWHKPNPFPESVKDRCTRSHEYIFLLTKRPNYYYNADAIREPLKQTSIERGRYGWNGRTGPKEIVGSRSGSSFEKMKKGEIKIGDTYHPLGANKKSVWKIATRPYKGAHFATFPVTLIEPMILAGSREGDLVLDPFSGSGTVGEVCLRHRRNFVGVEINPDYIALSKERVAGIQIRLF